VNLSINLYLVSVALALLGFLLQLYETSYYGGFFSGLGAGIALGMMFSPNKGVSV
jgi:hypothetical protein